MLERYHSLLTKYPLDVITHLFILLPLLVGLVRFALLKRDMTLVLLFFFIDFGTETILLFRVLNGGTTTFMPDIRASLNIMLIAGIYTNALVRPKQKQAIGLAGVGCLLLSLIVYSGEAVSPWSQTVCRVYAVSAALVYYTAILSDLNLRKIYHHSLFWFTAGLLFYAGGTFFITLFNQYIYAEDTPDAIFDRYTHLMQILYMLFCLLTTVGFWVSKADRENYFERESVSDTLL